MVSNYNIGPGNLILHGGVIESYWANNFIRALGSGPGQVQITGGASGVGINGATGMSVIFGNTAAFEAVWGTLFFNPSTLVLQAPSAQAKASITFATKIDLNGANGTVAANGTNLGVTSTISGAIRNSVGTAAGLTKTGPGLLILTAANTYDGGTTINQGNLRFGGLTSMPAAGDVAVQTGTTLTIEGGGTGEWTTDTSGNGTVGGLLARPRQPRTRQPRTRQPRTRQPRCRHACRHRHSRPRRHGGRHGQTPIRNRRTSRLRQNRGHRHRANRHRAARL